MEYREYVLGLRHIASGLESIFIKPLGNDEGGFGIRGSRLEKSDKLLRLGFGDGEGIDEENIAKSDSGAESLAKCEFLNSLWSILSVVAWHGAVSDTATNPNRAGKISRTGAAGALLAPGLATREIHIALGLGAGCSTAAGGLDRHDDIVHGLVALGLVGDEFNLCLLGVLGGENCRAHELETETAQAFNPAL